MQRQLAKLIQRSTADGLFEIHDHIELDRVYIVDPDSIRVLKFYNTKQKKEHEKECIEVLCSDGAKELMPTELIEIFED